MQLTITIPDELAAQAQARGLALERYLPALLAEDLGAVALRPTAGFNQRSATEAVDNIRAHRRGTLLGGLKIKDLVDEGRKY